VQAVKEGSPNAGDDLQYGSPAPGLRLLRLLGRWGSPCAPRMRSLLDGRQVRGSLRQGHARGAEAGYEVEYVKDDILIVAALLILQMGAELG
jgi:hypothetical protein